MKFESPPNNNIEGYNFLNEKIEEAFSSVPKGEDKRKHVLETLSNIYGKEIAEIILNNIPDTYFNENEKETEDKYGLNLEKVKDVLKDPIIKKMTKYGLISAIGIASIIGLIKKSDFKIKDEITITKEKTISNFNKETYESLPEQAKEVYKYISEENPTPGRGYQILDKESATLYIFNKDNELINKVAAGFGKDEGDEPNTSYELNKGNQTTPSGVYLFSNYSIEEDIKKYGELQFSLVGESVLGDITYIGQHKTYPPELNSRTKKLNSETPFDNKFSDGCINIDEKDFQKYIKPNFKGDYGEFLFILQDKKSKQSGVKYNVKSLVSSVIPMMIEMSNNEITLYSDSLVEIRDSVNKISIEMDDLEKERLKLTEEYSKDKSENKEQRIKEIKDEIKKKKNERGKLRELMNIYTDKIKGVQIKRDRVEKILLEVN